MFVVTFRDHVTELHYAGSVSPSLVGPGIRGPRGHLPLTSNRAGGRLRAVVTKHTDT